MENTRKVNCSDKKVIAVNKYFLSLCENVHKMRGDQTKVNVPSGILEIVNKLYLELLKNGQKDLEPFEVQPENKKLFHTKMEYLFKPLDLKLMNSLWNEGYFNEILKYLEILGWKNLTHTMMIYLSAKLRNINPTFVQNNYDLNIEDFISIEMTLIKSLVKKSTFK